MCSFHQSGCSVVIDALLTPCVNAYDMVLDRDFVPESEVACAALREVINNARSLVRYITSTYSCQVTNIFVDTES